MSTLTEELSKLVGQVVARDIRVRDAGIAARSGEARDEAALRQETQELIDALSLLGERALARARATTVAMAARFPEEKDDEPDTTRWFGTSWRAPVCQPEAHIATPVGASCTGCSQPIEDGDRGVAVPDYPSGRYVASHLECFLHGIGADVTREVMDEVKDEDEEQ